MIRCKTLLNRASGCNAQLWSKLPRQVDEKVAEYLSAGTHIVWVAYPKSRHVVAHYANGEIRNFTAEQILDAGNLLPGLNIPVKDVFPSR